MKTTIPFRPLHHLLQVGWPLLAASLLATPLSAQDPAVDAWLLTGVKGSSPDPVIHSIVSQFDADVQMIRQNDRRACTG